MVKNLPSEYVFALRACYEAECNHPICLCGGPESGNMIACDNPGCSIEWFHFECVGLVDAPSGKWLCTECAV